MIAKLRIALLLPAVALAACQSTLDPVVPAGQAAYEAIAVPDEAEGAAYALRPGDAIGVLVYGEPELTQQRLLIDETGHFNLPLIGQIRALGRTTAQLSEDIAAAYRAGFVRDPRITVSLLEATGGAVAVEGEVKAPGIYPIRPGHTLLAAMALAGSPLPTGRVDHVLIYRKVDGQRMGGRFDIKAIRDGAVDDPLLRDGDVVVVGFSRRVGIYQDLLKLTPLLNTFVLLETRN